MNDKMLKSKFCGSMQEVILPDFLDDDDTVTTTVTKSRRVSFGTNFVKEFVVGSAVSAQCVSEYEQAFSSSDSSNANSSHSAVNSGILSQNTFVVDDNHKPNPEPEDQIKRPKISSTICFTADSPTADMEFTEGCISLAKSILDKKNKEMTVIIQAKPKDAKEETKIIRDEETKFFEGSQFDMSMTKCFKTKENRKEDRRFESEKTKIFNDEMSFTRCDNVFRMRQSKVMDDEDMSEEEDNCKENIMPLDMIMRHLDKDNSDLEKSLFNPEKLLTEALNKNPLNFSGESEKLNLNESMDISKDLAPVLFKVPYPVPTPTKNVLADMSIESKLEEEVAKPDELVSLSKRNSEDMSIEGNDNEHVLEEIVGLETSQPIEQATDLSMASKNDEEVIVSQPESAALIARESDEMSVESKDDERIAPTVADKTYDLLTPIPLSTSSIVDDVAVGSSTDVPVALVSRVSEDMSIESKDNEESPKVDDPEICEVLPSLAEDATADEKTPEPMCLIATRKEPQNEVSMAIHEDVDDKISEVVTDPTCESSCTKTEDLAMETNEEINEVDTNEEKNVGDVNAIGADAMEMDEELDVMKTKAQEEALTNKKEAEEQKDENLSVDAVPESQTLEDASKTEDLVSLATEEIIPAEDDSFCLTGNGEDKTLNSSSDEFGGEEGSLSKIDITLSDFVNEEAMEESVTESIPKNIQEEDSTPPAPPVPVPALSKTITSEPSFLDAKVIQNVKDQASEPGCTWKLKEFTHPQSHTLGLLSFDFDLLESTTCIEFVLESSDDDTLDSCSSISDCRICLNEDEQFRPPEYELVSQFGFEKLKKVFEKERKSVKTIRHVPHFLDMMNLFVLKNNSYLKQVYSILTSYPGSRLKGSILSFRLYSFPIFFSCTVSIDLTDVHRLSSSSLSFEFDFGTLDKTKIVRIFEESLKSENALVDFVVRSNRYLIDVEQKTGYISKRQHIRLLPPELH